MTDAALLEAVTRSGTVILQTGKPPHRPEWSIFERPRQIISANSLRQVRPALAEVEDAARAGNHAAGFIAYEAAPAFDPVLRTREPVDDLPLLWFGVYGPPQTVTSLPEAPTNPPAPLDWQASQSLPDYEQTIAKLRRQIALGNTYQVNYTIRLQSTFDGDPWALFLQLNRAQRSRYSAYIRTGRHSILSASPELFFEREGNRLISRPMKGTAARGLTTAEDRRQADALAQSPKDHAENVMIVDMVRNDLGRIADTGSVRVPRLFEVERYDTVWQMTSTVTANSARSLCDVLAALFPCASVTGAPKVRTMQIIAETEDSPRGVYTGCIGLIRPSGDARFSVAIRTMQIDHVKGAAVYGTGGGIVWDSDARSEYEECRTKARVLFEAGHPRALFESLRWDEGSDYFLLEEHLQRLSDSADYFGFPFHRARIERELMECGSRAVAGSCMVRLLLAENGAVTAEVVQVLPALSSERWVVALAREPIDESNRFLYHKTTERSVYDAARADFPGCDDVILWNTRGEITETTRANVVVQRGGRMVTPPVSCGLLAGTFRRKLLETGEVVEEIVRREELGDAEAIFLVNSVRGWIRAELR